ncbi:MAG: leucine-rich repeat domain-containing protein, partial [Clostridia bacterium]|nr:leucine-rich repeat domain-containing protein [Clostridia bacterium]
MKKIINILILCLILPLCLSVAACSKSKVATPSASLDEDNKLFWSQVDGARSYNVEIFDCQTERTTQENTKKTYYSLDSLEEGDYVIRLMSVGDAKTTADSPWSADIEFHKDYTTGCIYTLINNSTEYQITKVGKASGTFTIEDFYKHKPVTAIAKAAFKGSGKIENVTIGANVTSIGENAFYNCSKLTTVVIPDSVGEIGKAAFQSCRALTSIEIPASIKTINDYTFAYCKALQSVVLHEGVTSIGESAFSDCSVLTSVDIPDTVRSLADYAFANDGALTTVTVGKGVETIG